MLLPILCGILIEGDHYLNAQLRNPSEVSYIYEQHHTLPSVFVTMFSTEQY